MAVRVAVQMDPMESINIAGDSSFAIMLGAQKRGHRLFHYLAPDLSYSDGRVRARVRPVEVRNIPGDPFTFGEWPTLDPAPPRSRRPRPGPRPARRGAQHPRRPFHLRRMADARPRPRRGRGPDAPG